MADRSGKRKTREQLSKRRVPELGYYFIVTDTEETEQNYLYGLRDSIPKALQGKLAIIVSKTKTVELIDEANNLTSIDPQYRELWIMFDRDQVIGFDQMISLAEDKGIKAAWSNPCIEIWFNAYLGGMPTYPDSVACCDGFEKQYLKITKHKYKKSDTAIYTKLCRFGNEKTAIEIAERKLQEHEINCNTKPSEMCPCTTVHILIKEIKGKIENE